MARDRAASRAEFSVVAADLRGYGDSSKRPSTPDHTPYSKRAMVPEQIDVVPTGNAFRGANMSFAMDFWVWFFLAQPPDRPERVIGANRWYDVLAGWRAWADDVRGKPIDCGHFLPEEAPDETFEALREFLVA